jgi:PHD/YefM family antitoxin component YafN of YafNO toxin-antitoxin module
VPVSALFLQQQIADGIDAHAARAERDLMASWDALTTPFAASWRAAGVRLREERLMGLHRPMRRVSVAGLAATPLVEMEAACEGAHVVIEGVDGPAAVMVSAEEYDRLKVDRRLLRWERTE